MYDIADGTFLLKTFNVVKIRCEMNFRRYPFDTQTCMFRMSTMRYMSQQVKAKIVRSNQKISCNSFQEFLTTIDLSNRLHDDSFDLHLQPLTKNWHYSKSGNDNYSISGFTAKLDRSPNKFLMNTYLPISLLTIASFIGFLIPADMVPGRMALLVTIFLMIVNIRSTEQRMGPQVSNHFG